MIEFVECQKKGYAPRTYENARADITLAIAKDFTTAGEKLTRQAVEYQGKTYVSLDFYAMKYDKLVAYRLADYFDSLALPKITLNIAGNGLYTLKCSQQIIDDIMLDLLSNIVDRLKTKLELVISRGQTGADEAGVKAANRLGMQTKITAPKGWAFRDRYGKDHYNEQEFKARFVE